MNDAKFEMLAPQPLLNCDLTHQLDFSKYRTDDVKRGSIQYGVTPNSEYVLMNEKNDGVTRRIFFAQGDKDAWCAWVSEPTTDGWRCACPSDKHYFEVLLRLSQIFGVDAVWQDMLHIFHAAGKEVQPDVISAINTMAAYYGKFQRDFVYAAMSVYYGMVAEWYYPNTYFGKLVKINGLYSCLKGGRTVEEAADECRRVNRYLIEAEANQRHLFLSEGYMRSLSGRVQAAPPPVRWC